MNKVRDTMSKHQSHSIGSTKTPKKSQIAQPWDNSRPGSVSATSRKKSVAREKWSGSESMGVPAQEPIMRKRTIKDGSSIFSTDVDAHEVLEDLLGLGIKLDKNQVLRMQQSLNTRSRLETARKLANERREALDGNYTEDPKATIARSDLALSRSYASTYSAHKGFMPLNSKRVAELVRDIDNRTGALKADSRAAMKLLIDKLQVEYKRNADTFVLRLLNITDGVARRGMARSKSYTKDLLKDDSNRFLDMTAFTNGVINIVADAEHEDTVMLFSLLSERMRQMDEDGRVWTMIVCVDVVGFLCLLGHASTENRRSFANKTSKAANDVEFWSDKRHNFTNKPTLHPAEPKAVSQASNRGMSVRPRTEFGAVGGNSEQSNFIEKLKPWSEREHERINARDTVPALINSPVRKRDGQSYGILNKEYCNRDRYSVEEALASPRKTPFRPERNSHTVFENEQYQKKDPQLLDQMSDIKKMGTDGVGMHQAMGTKAATSLAGVEKVRNGFASLEREEKNLTTVAGALGNAREDFIGRSVAWQDKKCKQLSDYTLPVPPEIPSSSGTTDAVTPAPEPAAAAAAPPAAAPPAASSIEGRNVVKHESPIRQRSWGTFSRDTVSDRSQYSVSTALASPRFSNKKPEGNSRFHLEVEQYQRKPAAGLNNYNSITRQGQQGVGVFQCMNYCKD